MVENQHVFQQLFVIKESDQFEQVHEILDTYKSLYEPPHEIFNNVVCATSKASDQPVYMRSLIRAFASRLNIL